MTILAGTTSTAATVPAGDAAGAAAGGIATALDPDIDGADGELTEVGVATGARVIDEASLASSVRPTKALSARRFVVSPRASLGGPLATSPVRPWAAVFTTGLKAPSSFKFRRYRRREGPKGACGNACSASGVLAGRDAQ